MPTRDLRPWPAGGQIGPDEFKRMLHHARRAVVQALRTMNAECDRPCCPNEPYIMANLVIAILTGTGYKDLLEKYSADSARTWLEEMLLAVSTEVEHTTGQRLKFGVEVRDNGA